jgi:uncharacterized protein (TIGR02117 family)
MPRVLRVFLLLLLAACSAVPPRPMPPHGARPTDSSSVIYLIRRKWHVDIGFAAADLQAPLASLRADFPAARYLLFGFGDRHYLLDKDRGLGGMAGALWPGPGLMLVTALATTLQAAFGDGNVIEIAVTPAQSADAQAFIWRSLATDDGAIAPLRAGPYDGSLYYASSERYSAVHTCNTWAAQGLQAAQLPVHSQGIAFAGQLWRQAQRLGSGPGADPVRIDASPGRAPPPPSTQLHGG